ncbi:MAG: hypothetical protein ACXIUM_15660 [Wenzhouxiangella sp.]
MSTSNRPAWMKTVGLRMILASVLIVVLTSFYVYLVFFTEMSMLAMAGIALLILLTLSTATAWTATGVPGGEDEDRQRDD